MSGRKSKKKKKVVKKAKAAKPSISKAVNRSALWEAYRSLQRKADLAWDRFRSDVKRKASSDVLIKDHTHLLLLLGECNYMARECMRLASKPKKKR